MIADVRVGEGRNANGPRRMVTGRSDYLTAYEAVDSWMLETHAYEAARTEPRIDADDEQKQNMGPSF